MARTKTKTPQYEVLPPLDQGSLVVVGPEQRAPANSRMSQVQLAEAWANLIGWKLFGLLCFVLLFGQIGFGWPSIFPPWMLLAMGGAGLGGRELASVITSVLVGLGRAAEGARSPSPGNRRTR